MSAVWRASRGAVRRRRLQTFVIGLVVLCSTATTVLALSLLAAASSPFDAAFGRQRGAHAVVTFDAAKAGDARLAATAKRPGVAAAAGPFSQAVLHMPEEWLGRAPGPMTVVGRPGPGGPVDRVQMLAGRWATRPGEVVVSQSFGSAPRELLGTVLHPTGAPPLTVVGFADSMSRSAGAWVAPAQMPALHPSARQMLYRFDAAGSDGRIRAGTAAATAGLPAGAVTSTQSSAVLKQAFSAQARSYLPMVTVFGVLGLLVSVLIVGNVVSGAVIAGTRHIGMLKALGFTPNQVAAVYLTMVSVPAVAGSVLGTLLGRTLAKPFLRVAFTGIQTGTASIGSPAWTALAALLGMPALVAVAALVPALRAHRLSAAGAISAGSAPRAGRGLRVQRALSGTRLPRAISLGLGQPFARPGRTLMTLAAIGLGVTTVTLATGMSSTMIALQNLGGRAPGVSVMAGVPDHDHQVVPRLDDRTIEARLAALPGADRVTVRTLVQVSVSGVSQPVFGNFYRGDITAEAAQIVKGRLPTGPGEVVAGPQFLGQNGLRVGDRITLGLNGRQVPATVVGELVEGNARALDSNAQTLALLHAVQRAMEFDVRLAPGADRQAYAAAARTVDPGLYPSTDGGGIAPKVTVIGFSTAVTVLLSIVAALGVFNTVLLTTRERRRDLGMLKSIGMTPRQVVAMTVTSVAAPGLVGGLAGVPLGLVAHRMIVDHVPVIAFPESTKDVWHAPQLAGLVLAGVAIAVLGALVPARSAARLAIAQVLHNE
ncbi:FtsX-like permease family protein [Streptomyces sp. NPDC020917]|uniref:ABC transporter permease n=1 Tax=Streptomyces sp. NPDC020917 TaxID=3365102 RepID=UPI0037A7F0A9